MKQELFIEGEKVSYSIQTKNVVSVLGRVYIYRKATTEDVLKIVWMGLTSQKGFELCRVQEDACLGFGENEQEARSVHAWAGVLAGDGESAGNKPKNEVKKEAERLRMWQIFSNFNPR
ncbi:hypothetical protein [Hoylesella timonensis]|uniref:hypothetical protein n=1 Tax=Hoylesella timonensis TaxID=386414 RepID=UPI002430C14C|nr:hypothetical protein [Hoylesella timonensis]